LIKCYFCDREIEKAEHSFKIGSKVEPVCDECYLKTMNRKKALMDSGAL
jgi:ribosome-binding protein aMBF1 (putative translation factor)